MARALGISGAFLAAAICASGCGSGSSSTSSQAAAGTSRATEAPGSIGKARAIAYAHQVNLIAADVPGSRVISQEREAKAPSAAAQEFARCAGAASPERQVADIQSATFVLGRPIEATRVRSSIEVFPTASLAAHNYAAIRSARGRACLARLLPQAVQSTPTRRARLLGPTTVSFLPSLLPPGQKSFGVRLQTTVIATSSLGKQIRLAVFLDAFDLHSGPVEITLQATSTAHPVPAATERRLLSVLYGRAEANNL
jgi:hypothetical protein